MSSSTTSPSHIDVQSDSSGPLPRPHQLRQPFTVEQAQAEEHIQRALHRHNVCLPAPVREPPSRSSGKRRRGETSSSGTGIAFSGKVPLSSIIQQLDTLEVDDDTRAKLKLVSTVKILEGRFYPCLWYGTDPSLSFFLDIIIQQQWRSLIEFTGPVCPVEIFQFYSTINGRGDGVTATVNGTTFSITTAEFESIFHTPNFGVLLTPTSKWGTLSPAEIGAVKQRFGVAGTNRDTIHARHLSPHQRFLFNVACRTLTPRLSGRSHLRVFEVLLIDALLQGTLVNLPHLMLKYMVHMGDVARKQTKSSETRLPYGVILTRIFALKNVLADGCPGYWGKDEMSPALLDQMQLASVNGMLVAKQGTLPAASSPSAPFDGSGPSNPPDSSSSAPGLERVLQWLTQTEAKFVSYTNELKSLGQHVYSFASVIDHYKTEQATTKRLLEALVEDFADLKGEWATTKPQLMTMMQNITTIGVGGGRMVETIDQTSQYMNILSNNSDAWNTRFDHILSRLERIDTILSRRF